MTSPQSPLDQPSQHGGSPVDDPGPFPTAAQIVGLLADEDRLRVVAALVLGAGSLDEVVKASGLAARDAAKALDRLTRGGLVVAAGDRARVASGGLRAAARQAHQAMPGEASGPPDAAGAHADPVLRSFVRQGRLVSIPAARGKRLVVLGWLVERFEPGRTYPEPETNRLLNEVHADHAALRRYLVDEGLLERRDGLYWRSGGAFDVDGPA